MNDDFLRELVGNILHKQGYYILNGSSIQLGINEAEQHRIDMVIINSDCPDFDDKSSIHYLQKELESPRIFLIHDGSKRVDYLPQEDQMFLKDLSVQKILEWVA